MSEFYSSGELAKKAGVSLRTVQYYDQRGILIPSKLTEGGRRLYSESDFQKLQFILYLREMNFSLEQIKKVFAEKNANQVLKLLLIDNIRTLEVELKNKKSQLNQAENLLLYLKNDDLPSLEKISDISITMKNQKAWRRLQFSMWLSLIAAILIYTAIIFLSAHFGNRWIAYVAAGIFIPAYTYLVVYFRKKFFYLCPNCHQTFKASFKEFAVAGHTPRTRKLTCPHCQTKSYCLELAKEETS